MSASLAEAPNTSPTARNNNVQNRIDFIAIRMRRETMQDGLAVANHFLPKTKPAQSPARLFLPALAARSKLNFRLRESPVPEYGLLRISVSQDSSMVHTKTVPVDDARR